MREPPVSQLPLALTLPDHARFSTFVPGTNGAALEHARAVAHAAGETLWLWGVAGSGKTHLLQAACREAADADRRAMYLALDDSALEPEVLAGLDELDMLALDRADAKAGSPEWERRLFVVVNDFLARRGSLLLAARTAPRTAGFRLPDLASRVAAAVTYRLQPLDDEDRVRALVGHAAARGLELDRAAAEYLLHRVARDMRGLGVWLERLDRASLAERRRVTIPFIRELLAAEIDRDD
jgi:DnaA-homolog protein